MHRTRAAAALCAVAVAVGALAGPAAAVPGLPAASPPLPGPEVGFAFGPARDGLIADDAVYWGFSFYRTSIFRSPLTHDGEATSFGEGQFVGRTMRDTAYAEHAGTLAYVRAVDGQLVLHAADGTETLPPWGEDARLRGGVVALTDRWVVGRSGYEEDLEQDHTVFDRATGEAYDLDALVDMPAGFTEIGERGLTITDERVLWSDWSTAGAAQDWLDRTAVHTAALGADGPVGPATTLDTGTARAWEPGTAVRVVGIEGSRLAWIRYSWDGATETTTVRWLDAAPYTGTPSEAAVDGEVRGLDDGAVVVHDPVGHRVTWTDLDAPATPVRATDVRHDVVAVGNGVVMHQTPGDIVIYLTDATGAPLSGDTGHFAAPSFSDVVDDDAFGDEILWLADRGVVGGYEDGTYRNRASVNRDAMAAFLYRAAHDDAAAPPCVTAPFADVAVDHPFCGEIAWLAETGVTTGWADGTFRPGAPISREAMAAFLYRMSVGTGAAPACTADAFTDVPTGSTFCGEIAWLAETGITTGWPDGTFRPADQIERQAMAAFLFRALDRALI